MSDTEETGPGLMHAVDRAFYELTLKQRDAAWRECEEKQEEIDRLSARLAEFEA